MIVKRLNVYDFMDNFKRMDRDSYSYEGYNALFEYLEEYSNDIGQSYILDVIAICSEFTEYENLDEFIDSYGESIDYTFGELEDSTIVIYIPNSEGFIIQDF